MKGLPLIGVAILAGLACMGVAVWFLHRALPLPPPRTASTDASPQSPRAGLERAMATWLLREGRRCLRHDQLQAAAAIAEEVAFFAGDESALPLRTALDGKLRVLRAEWQAISIDAAEAGDRAKGRRFEELLEEADELEAAGAADLR